MFMYARMTTFKVEPARLPELESKIADLTRLVQALPGMVDAFVAWRMDGEGMLVAIYESKGHADAAVGRIQSIWGALAGLVAGAPRTDAYENVTRMTR
jgi:hypothetical protein